MPTLSSRRKPEEVREPQEFESCEEMFLQSRRQLIRRILVMGTRHFAGDRRRWCSICMDGP
jgi:hypothetical protein